MSIHNLIWMQMLEDLSGLIPFSTSWISHGYNLLCKWWKWFLFFTSFIIQTLDTNQSASIIEVKPQPFNSILCDFLHLPERICLNWNWSYFLKRPSKLRDKKTVPSAVGRIAHEAIEPSYHHPSFLRRATPTPLAVSLMLSEQMSDHRSM